MKFQKFPIFHLWVCVTDSLRFCVRAFRLLRFRIGSFGCQGVSTACSTETKGEANFKSLIFGTPHGRCPQGLQSSAGTLVRRDSVRDAEGASSPPEGSDVRGAGSAW